MSLGRPSWLGGWRFWLVVVLVALALFVFFFVAFGKGEGGPAEPPAATGLN